LQVKADLGFAYDGDGDRLAVIDDEGNVIDNNKIFAVLIKHVLNAKPKSKIVYDALSSLMIVLRPSVGSCAWGFSRALGSPGY
jgi:phosphomannomutase